jgi:peptidoglycan/LPS O-acetylase OafA/YrhL
VTSARSGSTGSTSTQNPLHQPSRVRPEIQALRALAVGAVVFNHLWPLRLQGGFIGVDIFFVISGFLISGQLIREFETSGRIALGNFWARRARRLLPAALLVLVAVVFAIVIFLPITIWQAMMGEIVSSALYFENWKLIAQAANYFTSADAASPVTHYWSLSVEEQFYVAWPLIVVGAALAMRAIKKRAIGAIAVAFALVAILSLAYSVWITNTSPSAAYFSTFARGWEFALGGVLAVGSRRFVLRTGIAAAIGWLGWLLLIASFFVINEQSHFPGYIALLPVLGTVCVIFGGTPQTPFSATRIVRVRPVQFIGNISYGVYLWHWPPIIVIPYILGHPLSWKWKVLIIVGTIAAAWVTKKVVEDPVRTLRFFVAGRSWRTFVATAVAFALVLTLAGSYNHSVDVRRAAVVAQLASAAAPSSASKCFAAAALATAANKAACTTKFDLANPDAALINSVNQGNPVDMGTTCQQDPLNPVVLSCEFGASAATASMTVAMVGDSHAGHYIQAFNELATAHNWRVILYLHSSCPAALSDTVAPSWDPSIGPACHVWEKSVIAEIAADKSIDLVVTSSLSREYNSYDSTGTLISHDLAGDYEKAWTVWANAGKKVFVLGDVPDMNLGDIPTCLAESKTSDDPCTQTRVKALTPDPMVLGVKALNNPNVSLFNTDKYICTATKCHSVVGGIPVFADATHLNGSFSRSLAPYIYAAMPAIAHKS